MRRLIGPLIAAFAAFVWTTPAQASSDFSCWRSLTLVHSSRSGCDDSAMLGPANDTRTNLTLLLIDRHGNAPQRDESEPMEPLFSWPTMRYQLYRRPGDKGSSYADGEGSRCRSNASGAEAFEAATGAASKLKPDERETLIAARRALQPNCTGASAGAEEVNRAAAQMKSSPGREFAAYLQGALAFYDGDYDAAAARFGTLRSAKDAWVRETARYMSARVEVNRAQISAFDEYGYWAGPEKTDQKVIDAAEAALLDYGKAYPRGRYAGSARGLLRRVYWLGGRTAKLAAQYAALFALDPEARGASDAELAEEIDNKLLPELTPEIAIDPSLLAMFDLMRMRRCECEEQMITIEELEAQRHHFAGHASLFDYLLAAHAFYVSDKPEAVLPLIPEAAPPADGYSYLEFSRQMLRRVALQQLGRPPEEASWLAVLPGANLPWQRSAVELALALHYERNDALARTFAAGSPVQDATLRETLLINVADAPLLRARAADRAARQHEREVALFTLLYKQLTRGAYRPFLADLALIPADASSDGNLWDLVGSPRPPLPIFTQEQGSLTEVDGGTFACPPIKAVAEKLASMPGDTRSRLCLADFLRVSGFDGNPLDQQPGKDELGGTPSRFAGGPFSRLELYKTIIADPKVTPGEKAYALYRAVQCYAPTGNNSCGGTDVSVSQRRGWFQRLKKDYAASPWAKDLKYYW